MPGNHFSDRDLSPGRKALPEKAPRPQPAQLLRADYAATLRFGLSSQGLSLYSCRVRKYGTTSRRSQLRDHASYHNSSNQNRICLALVEVLVMIPVVLRSRFCLRFSGCCIAGEPPGMINAIAFLTQIIFLQSYDSIRFNAFTDVRGKGAVLSLGDGTLPEGAAGKGGLRRAPHDRTLL